MISIESFSLDHGAVKARRSDVPTRSGAGCDDSGEVRCKGSSGGEFHRHGASQDVDAGTLSEGSGN